MNHSPDHPVFIVGAPRSGTSLLRVMLNRHPAIGLCDETYFFFYVYERRHAFGDLRDQEVRREVVERYLATDRIRRLGLDPDALGRTLLTEGHDYPDLFASLLRHYAAVHGKTRWGEKTPQHAFAAPAICEWYPNCTLIHLVRDPRDVVASLLRMPWGHRTIALNARLWNRCTEAAEQCRDLPNYLLVRYMDLVQQPETELKRVCAAIGEEYLPGMLATETAATTDRWWFERALGPLTRQRRNAYRTQLSAGDIALVEHLTGPGMERFGYQRSEPPPSAPSIALAYQRAAAEALASRARNLPRLWYRWRRPTDLAADEAFIDGLAARRARG